MQIEKLPIANSIETQIVSIEGFANKAQLCRLVGDRKWAVHGSDSWAGSFTVVCYDGNNTEFSKKTAMKMAEQYIRHGREFL